MELSADALAVIERTRKWVSVEGGWDGIADASGQVICRLGLNVPENVRLIAAAPDLYVALRDLLDNPLDMHVAARAASVLAKVEADA